MNEPASQWNSSSEPVGESLPADEDLPRFGAIDIVEAFTAMRHEWRGQTREGRALAEQVQAAVANLRSLEEKLSARPTESRPDSGAAERSLVQVLVETDHQLSRAVAAIAQWEAKRRAREEQAAMTIEQRISAMSPLSRWFARPLLAAIAERDAAGDAPVDHPAIEGLNLLQARLRRGMHEQGIERLDVEGQPFDAETMYAIGTVASENCPQGHVAEQLSPAYRWQGRILRYADVRVAQ